MNMYRRLELHLEMHKYIKGAHKGDAPADASNRAKSHFRVSRGNGCMVVRMHRTDLITAYLDGRVEINTDGWDGFPTTRACLAYSLRLAGFPCPGIRSRLIMGVTQSVIYVGDVGYLYYDGITFDAEGKLLTEPRAFEQRRIDKAESKEFMDGVKSSGFMGAFRLLYATAEVNDARVPAFDRPDRIRAQLTDVDDAPYWSNIIAGHKFTSIYNYSQGSFELLEMGTAKSCWTLMMAKLKADMRVITRSDVTTVARK